MKEQNNTQDVPSVFSDFDLYLFGQSKHYRIYEKMGAHRRTVNGVTGTNFATWAPNALAGSLIGDFNNWMRDANPMHLRHATLRAPQRSLPSIHHPHLYHYT